MVDQENFAPDVKRARGDNSVDVHTVEASAPTEQQTGDAAGPSQQRQAQQMFGEGVQGPAGVRTGLAPVEAENKSGVGDLEPGAAERPQGVVGPSGPLDEASIPGTAEATEAAAKAHHKSDNPDDIIDALEAAEAKYNKTHPEEAAGDVGKAAPDKQVSKTGHTGPTAAAAASPGVPAQAGKGIDQEIRSHAQTRLAEALQGNPSVKATQQDKAVKDIELQCFERASAASNSRALYHNLMANATRLAKSENNVQYIARIAAGEPDEVASGEVLKGQDSGNLQAGLQGLVNKPRHAVG